MGHKTELYQMHVDAGAKIVDFGGWDMPIHYGSQLEEHHHVRRASGMFDVSHMTIVDIIGNDAKAYLRYALANDVGKLQVTGKALYSGMLDESGCVLDDLIVYLMPTGYRMVVNCATRQKDLDWLNKLAENFDVSLEERPDLAMIAVQGPEAIEKVKQVSPEASSVLSELKVFVGAEVGGWMFCRTGYTGEDGLEVMVPAAEASNFWQSLKNAGVAPCGLGARDTLRLEAGMNLYGSDMDETVTPYQANMGWTVDLKDQERDFVGRAALEAQKSAGIPNKLVGLVLEKKGVLRAHQKVVSEGDESIGEITSGSFSPTLGYSVALARVPSDWSGECQVEMRGKLFPVKIVRPPFVRNGEKVYQP